MLGKGRRNVKSYKLENLTCAHCASSIEQALADLDCVSSVRLQFATLDLHLDTSDLERVRRTIETIEPGVRVLEPEAAAKTENPRSSWTLWAGWPPSPWFWRVSSRPKPGGGKGHGLPRRRSRPSTPPRVVRVENRRAQPSPRPGL